MTTLAIMTFGGEDILIPVPAGPLTSGYLVRELAARVPNHPSTFRLWVNDYECPIEGDATDLTQVVDPAKHITLLYEPYKSFDTSAELRTAVLEWSRGGIAKESVLKTYGHVAMSSAAGTCPPASPILTHAGAS
jgi:hypothetical protein